MKHNTIINICSQLFHVSARTLLLQLPTTGPVVSLLNTDTADYTKMCQEKYRFYGLENTNLCFFLSMLLCHTEYSITNRVYLQICGNCFEKTLFCFNVTVSRCIKKYFFPVWCGWNWLAWHRALTSTTLNAFGMNRHMSCEPGLVAQNQYQQ